KRRLLSGAVLASALVVSADLVAGAPPRQVFVRQAGAVSPALAMRSRMSLVCHQARSSTALSLVKLPRAAHVRRQSQSRDEDEEAMDQDMDSDDDEDDLPIFDELEWWEAPASWPDEVAQLFLPLGPHSAATDFVQNAPCASAPRARLYNLLCRLPLDDFDLQSVLYPPGSHLLTKSQLQGLFETAGIQLPVGRALDVGSGDGCLTAELRQVCSKVVAAETSRGMARRLRRQGYEVWREDVAETATDRAARLGPDGRFNLVSMFNVLDRCASPRRLLAAAHELLAPKAWLLLATPLPFVASYYGRRSRWTGKPLEGLG
ncbi:unnamed protein product, partial [Polarella glacialis]